MDVILWNLIGILIMVWCLYTGYQGYEQWKRAGKRGSKMFLFPLVVGILMVVQMVSKLF